MVNSFYNAATTEAGNATEETPSVTNTPVTNKDNSHIVVIVSLIIALFVIVLALVATIMGGLICKRCCCYKRGPPVSDLHSILDPEGNVCTSD